MTSSESIPKYLVRRYILVLFVIFGLIALLGAYRSETADDQIRENTRANAAVLKQVQINTKLLAKTVYQQCLEANKAAEGTNTVLETLITAVSVTASIGESEKADRIRKYRTAMVQPLTCTKL